MAVTGVSEAPGRCHACGHPPSDGDPIVMVAVEPMPGWGRGEAVAWVHESHTLDPRSGLYGAEVAR